MVRRLAAALALLGLLGCQVGTKVEHFPAAHGPEGVAVHLRVMGRQTAMTELSGELLAVEDSALLVREPSRGLVRVSFHAIQEADFKKMGNEELGGGQGLSREGVARLRLVSRFPQGLSPEVLQRLLALNRQSEVREVAP